MKRTFFGHPVGKEKWSNSTIQGNEIGGATAVARFAFLALALSSKAKRGKLPLFCFPGESCRAEREKIPVPNSTTCQNRRKWERGRESRREKSNFIFKFPPLNIFVGCRMKGGERKIFPSFLLLSFFFLCNQLGKPHQRTLPPLPSFLPLCAIKASADFFFNPFFFFSWLLRPKKGEREGSHHLSRRDSSSFLW